MQISIGTAKAEAKGRPIRRGKPVVALVASARAEGVKTER